jgi:hypothetical protein
MFGQGHFYRTATGGSGQPVVSRRACAARRMPPLATRVREVGFGHTGLEVRVGVGPDATVTLCAGSAPTLASAH